jgi:uncharacterized lipoprotein YehR (DUF1307 family)
MENYQKLEWLKLRDINPHPENPRIHTEEQIQKIARSIDQLGWGRPIVISSDNFILAGHGAYQASEGTNYKINGENVLFKSDKVPTVKMKWKHDAPEAIAYMIADNKTTEESDWNYGKLEANFKDIKIAGFNSEITGFDDVEIGMLSNLDQNLGFNEPMEGSQPQEAEPEIEGEKSGRSYTLHISFTDKEEAEKFMKFIGLDNPEMRGLTKLVDGDTLECE